MPEIFNQRYYLLPLLFVNLVDVHHHYTSNVTKLNPQSWKLATLKFTVLMLFIHELVFVRQLWIYCHSSLTDFTHPCHIYSWTWLSWLKWRSFIAHKKLLPPNIPSPPRLFLSGPFHFVLDFAMVIFRFHIWYRFVI